jgi:hypothetical protein
MARTRFPKKTKQCENKELEFAFQREKVQILNENKRRRIDCEPISVESEVFFGE